MKFASRAQAGRVLGERLRKRGAVADVVLGLPRGGVVVAAEVARVLDCPLAALIVRKIGHPHYREMAVGALAEPDVVVLDEHTLRYCCVSDAELRAVVDEELQRLAHYKKMFHPAGVPDLAGKDVWLVDDGLATGATMEAAVRSARQRQAAHVRVAVPVGAPSSVERIERIADEVLALVIDPNFLAVGAYYAEFTQVSDAEAVALLQPPRVAAR